MTNRQSRLKTLGHQQIQYIEEMKRYENMIKKQIQYIEYKQVKIKLDKKT